MVGHRAMAMQLACEALYLPAPVTSDILYANTHRELIAYGSTEPVEAAELQALMVSAGSVVEQARAVYPDWFL
jgi:hypothetical protein